jgi:hypothetical protein
MAATPDKPLSQQVFRIVTPLGIPFLILGVMKRRTSDMTLKAGGGTKAHIVYVRGNEKVDLGPQPSPWSLQTRLGLTDWGVRVDVSGLRESRTVPDTGGWCEIWIGDELCDREEDGSWYGCGWDDGVWSGDPNRDRSKRTRILW